MVFAYKTEYWMVSNLDIPLIFYKIVSEIVYRIKKGKNAKKSNSNEEYKIVLHTPHSKARWPPLPPPTQILLVPVYEDGSTCGHYPGDRREPTLPR